MIRGVVTGRTVLTHWHLIAVEFGWPVLGRCLRCIVLGRTTTFLEIVMH